MNTGDIRKLLQLRYGSQEWAWMEEVRNAAGHGANRSADFFAMNLWPSRGLSTLGFEIKCFRGDWLKELKSPEKTEQGIYKFCDHWWLVTGDDSIAKLEEIPPTWGYMYAKGSRLIVAKEAPRNPKPEVFTRDFIACLLKRANEGKISTLVLEERVESNIKDRLASKEKYHENEIERLEKKIKELNSSILDFENAAGIKFNGWYESDRSKKIGEAIKFIMDGGMKTQEEQLKKLQESAQQIVTFIDNSVKYYFNDNSKQDMVDNAGSVLNLQSPDADGHASGADVN